MLAVTLARLLHLGEVWRRICFSSRNWSLHSSFQHASCWLDYSRPSSRSRWHLVHFSSRSSSVLALACVSCLMWLDNSSLSTWSLFAVRPQTRDPRSALHMVYLLYTIIQDPLDLVSSHAPAMGMGVSSSCAHVWYADFGNIWRFLHRPPFASLFISLGTEESGWSIGDSDGPCHKICDPLKNDTKTCLIIHTSTHNPLKRLCFWCSGISSGFQIVASIQNLVEMEFC